MRAARCLVGALHSGEAVTQLRLLGAVKSGVG